MALISLQQMYDAWKRVADWVSGQNADAPAVQLTGSMVKLAEVNANTNITAGSNLRILDAYNPINAGVKSVRITTRCTGALRLRMTHRVAAGTSLHLRLVDQTLSAASMGENFEFSMLSDYFVIDIDNTTAGDLTLNRAFVIGVK